VKVSSNRPIYGGDKEQSIKHEGILTGLSSVFGHQVGGLAVIFEVLCNSADADVEEKSEAAGLLAQITSPWLEPPQPTSDGQNAWPTLHLTPYISSFIAALTGKKFEFWRSSISPKFQRFQHASHSIWH